MKNINSHQIRLTMCLSIGGTILSVLAATLTLRNLGGILSLFLERGGELDFVAIFSQTKDALITPNWWIPLLLWTAFAVLLLFFPPKGSKKPLWIALYACGGVVLLLVSFALSLLLCRVNDVRFIDLLRALLPVIGSL